jgi:uncharacterized protein (DUF58 family)
MGGLYLTWRFYALAGVAIVLFMAAFFIDVLFSLAWLIIVALLLVSAIEIGLLYLRRKPVSGQRKTAERLSNGDRNEILLELQNHHPLPLQAEVYDEVPAQLQVRDFRLLTRLKPGQLRQYRYFITPRERGEYYFGRIMIIISLLSGLWQRRLAISASKTIRVYPSYLQLRRYQLMAINDRFSEGGQKRLRTLGQSMEFDQIRNWQEGDDFRKINWKATAKRQTMMVNHYRDERSQAIYPIIDLGGAMSSAFNHITLLEYAINAALILSDISLFRDDRAGLISYGHKDIKVTPAKRQHGQMARILDHLYNIDTDFLEADFSRLYSLLLRQIRQRAALFLFTHFETVSAARRKLKWFYNLGRKHLLVLILFRNRDLQNLAAAEGRQIDDLYAAVLAQNMLEVQQKLRYELQQNGVFTLYSNPESLTADTINKYLEIKAKRLI